MTSSCELFACGLICSNLVVRRYCTSHEKTYPSELGCHHVCQCVKKKKSLYIYIKTELPAKECNRTAFHLTVYMIHAEFTPPKNAEWSCLFQLKRLYCVWSIFIYLFDTQNHSSWKNLAQCNNPLATGMFFHSNMDIHTSA